MNIDIQRVHVDDSNFDAQDKLFAEEFGFKIFSVAHIGIRDNMIEAWIGPTLIPVNHPLSQRIDSENSALVKSEDNKFQGGNKEIRPNSETISSYYVKLKVKDSPGVLAQVASEFGNTGISIREMRQPQSEEGSDATEMAFLLWPCVTHVLQSTLNSISRLNGVVLTVNRPLRAFNK